MPTPAKGYYTTDGQRVPSVTTILGRFKDSGALMQWAFTQGRNGAESLYEERDRAADVGTLAHAMCEAHLLGGEPERVLDMEFDDEKRGRVTQAYESFRSWLEQQRADVISAEQPLVSERYRFGGTPDFVLRTPNGLALGDLKTSNAVHREYALQIAAYGILWDETHPDDRIHAGYHLLRIGKNADEFEHRYWADLDDAKRMFLLLRDAYELDAQLKKRVA